MWYRETAGYSFAAHLLDRLESEGCDSIAARGRNCSAAVTQRRETCISHAYAETIYLPGLSRYFSTVVATQNYININTTASVCIKSIPRARLPVGRPAQSICARNFNDGTPTDIHSKFPNKLSTNVCFEDASIFREYYKIYVKYLCFFFAIISYFYLKIFNVYLFYLYKCSVLFDKNHSKFNKCVSRVLFYFKSNGSPPLKIRIRNFSLTAIWISHLRIRIIVFEVGEKSRRSSLNLIPIRFLSTRSEHSISRGRISVPIADFYLNRSSFYLRPWLVYPTTIDVVTHAFRRREKRRNIGKWFSKVRLRPSSATPGWNSSDRGEIVATKSLFRVLACKSRLIIINTSHSKLIRFYRVSLNVRVCVTKIQDNFCEEQNMQIRCKP